MYFQIKRMALNKENKTKQKAEQLLLPMQKTESETAAQNNF